MPIGNLAAHADRYPVEGLPHFQPEMFRNEEFLLFRRLADRQRAVLAVVVLREVEVPSFDRDGRADEWYFGVLRYEWRHALFAGKSSDAGATRWFVPRYVIEWIGDRTLVHAMPEDVEQVAPWIEALNAETIAMDPYSIELTWDQHVPRDPYIQSVRKLLAQIQRGDIYEVNYCTERHALDTAFDPFAAFAALDRRSQAPFSAFLREGDSFALCASPERFLAFNGRHVAGEPMKGTRPRSTDAAADRHVAQELANNAKERSENIMALDVMRHDLSHIAASGTVKVTELCAVRSYPHHVALPDLDATGDSEPGSIVELRKFEDARGRNQMMLAVRSDLDLERQVTAAGATWLDRQAVSHTPTTLADAGFGADVKDAMDRRAEHLIGKGLAERQGQRVIFARNLLSTLRDREINAIGARLAMETSKPFQAAKEGEFASGVYRRRLALASGRFAMIDNGLGFQLVPWTGLLHKMPAHTRTVCLEFYGQVREAVPAILEIRDYLAALPKDGEARVMLAGLEHLDERYVKAVGYASKAKHRGRPKMVLLGDIVGDDDKQVALAASEVVRLCNARNAEGFIAVSPETRKTFWLDRARTAAIAKHTNAFKIKKTW